MKNKFLKQSMGISLSLTLALLTVMGGLCAFSGKEEVKASDVTENGVTTSNDSESGASENGTSDEEDGADSVTGQGSTDGDTIVLRVCNWEEYIDEGDWDQDEAIELENGEVIFGENSMVEDFEDWYYQTYGKKVKVEYSCFGTNEELYSQLTIGDTFDLVCPSEYMIMKMASEDMLLPYSDSFFDTTNPYNYYVNGVSPYIANTFAENEIDGVPWSDYAACYMWGVTGTLYNPEYMSEEDASTILLYNNAEYSSRFTLKDNVRDTYFVTLGIYYYNTLTSEEFLTDPDYHSKLAELMNDTSESTINSSEKLLQDMVKKVYSLETDSGKADMITGKVYASYQWSGDAVYAMDQAEEDGIYLNFEVPKEVSNMYFDGWVMLKKGIGQDSEKQQAAEAFVNFLSRPDNAVRNMYYIGYTSSIAGGDSDTVIDYLKWNYEDQEGDTQYPLGFFFTGDNSDPDYMITCNEEDLHRQLGGQYPSEDVMRRTAIMGYYNATENANINQMWINVRCFDLDDVPFAVWILLALLAIAGIAFVIWKEHVTKLK